MTRIDTQRIDGKAAAAALSAETAAKVTEWTASGHRRPALAVVLVGEDPASQVYVRNKQRQTEAVGMRSIGHHLPADIDQAALLHLVAELNADPEVDGILVQLPLPKHIDTARVMAAIDPDKDVDGLHVVNAGRLANGLAGLVPCTPLGCLILLEQTLGREALRGANALVIGRSILVGKPVAQLLLGANCTVTIAHGSTRDLPDAVRAADIVVAAVGRPKLIAGGWLKPGATVIDVGINRVETPAGKSQLVGDVDYESAQGIAAHITPVPGGVGPMTIACLLANTLKAAELRRARLLA